MFRIVNFKKSYGPVVVLQIEQLLLNKGIYWLKGENGSGKTTLMKSAAGLLPFEGEIDVQGIHLKKQRRSYTKKVAFAEAEPTYPAFLTGNDLLQFYLETKGDNRIELLQMAEVFGIVPYLKAPVGTYSSGMLKKLSLLLSFAGEPQLLLLDEPYITLDVKAVETLSGIIADKSNKGISFLISSHQALQLNVPYRTLHISQQTIKHETHAEST